nr:sigma-70 family RNA polymerase sigma factor [uncultured Draconibacterium sp.]
MTNDSHEQILQKVRIESEKTFEILYTQYAKMLYQYGLKFTSKNDLIEDCIQELFIKILSQRKISYSTEGIKYYLMKSFRNNLIRSINQEKRYSFEEKDDYFFEISFSIEHQLIESELEQKKAKLLTKALKKLSVRQKEAIYLRYTNELEYEEIAEIMKMSIEGSRNLIYRAIKSLRRELNSNSIVLLLIFGKGNF